MSKKIFIKTFGCQMNEYDSNRIYDLTANIGFNKTNTKAEADCFLLNTCHIREKATEKVYHEIGRVKKNFRNSKKPLVIVSGCVAQAESEEMIKREPYIDMVIGPQSYHKIGDLILNYQRKLIAKAMSESEDHPDVDALYQKVSKLDSKISIATVYRTVKLFEEAGIIAKHDFKGNKARYEQATQEHHDHLIDINTGEITEFVNEDIEKLQKQVAEKLGYKLVDHRLELYGSKIKK